MTTGERALLVEQASSSWRPQDLDGVVLPHPAWHDLDDAGRRELFEVSQASRQIEAALDADGLSSTARAVLARIAGSLAVR
jgi:hypothetical protein